MLRESIMERIAIAVLCNAGEVLIGPRADSDFLAGCWEFPGGKITPDENPAEAAARECKEETGLEVTVLGKCAEVVHHYAIERNHNMHENGTFLKLHLSFFACHSLDCKLPVKPPFRWVGLNNLSSMDFPAANRALITKLADENFIEKFWGATT
ncbi:MAG: hypothetical protein CMJ74_12460 [Planctomycetaceae bacterium]|nr:hypothetical protein [Planctomycetaceae bacterium]